jgi:hypothetical protein
MKYFPYYFSKGRLSTKTLGTYNVIDLHILLEDGVKPWEEVDGTSAQEACECNDMKIRHLVEAGDKAWININEQETSLEDFFTYEEIVIAKTHTLDTGALLWRTWRILVDAEGKLAFIPRDFPKDFITNKDLFGLNID